MSLREISEARGGNWGPAGYYPRRVGKLENTLKVLRPKHRERLERFQSTAPPAVIEAVAAEDLAGLEAAYAAATDLANRLHHESGYPYVKWVLPAAPPVGLQLEPVAAPAAAGAGKTAIDRSSFRGFGVIARRAVLISPRKRVRPRISARRAGRAGRSIWAGRIDKDRLLSSRSVKSGSAVVHCGRFPRDRPREREPVLEGRNMFHWNCIGKKVVPTIIRGAELGESGQSRTPRFWHETKSPVGTELVPGDLDWHQENIDPNDLFERLLSGLRPSDNNAVKDAGRLVTADCPIIFDHCGPIPAVVSRTTIPSVSCPTLKGDDGWATEQEIGAT
jgi:hypothetical protein